MQTELDQFHREPKTNYNSIWLSKFTPFFPFRCRNPNVSDAHYEPYEIWIVEFVLSHSSHIVLTVCRGRLFVSKKKTCSYYDYAQMFVYICYISCKFERALKYGPFFHMYKMSFSMFLLPSLCCCCFFFFSFFISLLY